MKTRVAACAVAVLLASPASAQNWDWQLTPYLWTSGIVGDIALGPVARDVDVDFADLVDVLAGAALVHAEARKGEHAVFGDLIWMSLEPEDDIATIGGVAEAQFDSTIVELGYARELTNVGIELGVRYWDLELEIDPAQVASIERADDWIDAFIGIRDAQDLGDHWSLTSRINLGAGGSDFTYGLQFDFARELEAGNAIVAGLKILDIDYEEASVNGTPYNVDTTFIGATIGFLFD
jgi:hypothetical protein